MSPMAPTARPLPRAPRAWSAPEHTNVSAAPVSVMPVSVTPVAIAPVSIARKTPPLAFRATAISQLGGRPWTEKAFPGVGLERAAIALTIRAGLDPATHPMAEIAAVSDVCQMSGACARVEPGHDDERQRSPKENPSAIPKCVRSPAPREGERLLHGHRPNDPTSAPSPWKSLNAVPSHPRPRR